MLIDPSGGQIALSEGLDKAVINRRAEVVGAAHRALRAERETGQQELIVAPGQIHVGMRIEAKLKGEQVGVRPLDAGEVRNLRAALSQKVRHRERHAGQRRDVVVIER